MRICPVGLAALAYLRAGFSVIPTRHQDKKPLITWKEFQDRRPDEVEVLGWYRRWPGAGVAVVCGRVSRLVVVDGDPRNGDGLAAIAPRLPPTPTVETGGGGRHYWFLARGARTPKVPALLPGVDLQAEASFAIAPPSIHPSGRSYRWLPGLSLGEVPLAPLPPIIRALITVRLRPDEPPAERRHPLRGPGLTLSAVLGALNGARRSGGGWIAQCPAHEDIEPSLSIGEGADSRVLLHCFAGCGFTVIVEAILHQRTVA